MHRGRPLGRPRPEEPRGARDAARAAASRPTRSIEGFRPGVMEKLGLGPDEVLARNPQLVYGRMTGYGQDGPMAKVAGHDINYISLAGALGAIQRTGEKPLAAAEPRRRLRRRRHAARARHRSRRSSRRSASGKGQVVDAAMVEGSPCSRRSSTASAPCGIWDEPPAPTCSTPARTSTRPTRARDGGHVAVGAIEPQFYAELLRLLELDRRRLAAVGPGPLARVQGALRRGLQDEDARRVGRDPRAGRGLRDRRLRPRREARRRTRTTSRAARSSSSPACRSPRPRRASAARRRAPRPRPREPAADTDAALAGLGLPGEEIAALRDSGALG